jgi:hypothetical protein
MPVRSVQGTTTDHIQRAFCILLLSCCYLFRTFFRFLILCCSKLFHFFSDLKSPNEVGFFYICNAWEY